MAWPVEDWRLSVQQDAANTRLRAALRAYTHALRIQHKGIRLKAIWSYESALDRLYPGKREGC